MLVPLNWLKDYVSLPPNPAELVERLTLAGLEAGSVRVFGLPVPEGLRVKAEDAGPVWERDKVVVAKVLSIDKHPNADKLKLVKLDYGTAEPKTVVTGATNIAPGQSGMKVVLGLRGTRYFYTDKDGKKATFTLEPKELRGIPNDAMCMSNFELGISDEHEGIIILDDTDPAPGTPLQDVVGEVVVDLDVLPNMARCLSLLGIAREVAALTGNHVCEPDLSFPTAKDAAEGKVKVEIADPKLCARYSATIIRNVKVGPAPRSMQSRLAYAGMRPINNVVDVTNFVMLEYGQPLHAFDYDVLLKRAGGKPPTIIVRPAKAGEKLNTLDGQDRELGPDNLVIADTAGPIALAGVMGGLETEVTEATTTILLEAASFDFVSVRKTARQFNLFSEAGTRFSRGVHPEVVKPAALRAAQLFHKYAGGEVLAGMVDNYPAPLPAQVVELNRPEIERLLGVPMSDGEVERVLTALQFQVEPTVWGWKVTTPPTRLDIQAGAADLIEELARVSGYDRLPESRLALELPEQKGNRSLEMEEKVRDLLADAGLQEVITYSLTSVTKEDPFSPIATTLQEKLSEVIKESAERSNATEQDLTSQFYVTLRNPVSPDRSVMRQALLPGVLAVAAENLKNFPSVALYELGPIFLPRDGEQLPDEPRRLAVVLSGRRGEAAWDEPLGEKPTQADFYDIKGVIAGLIADLHLPNTTFEPAKDVPYLHPGRSARLLVNGQSVGAFGELHPKVAAAFRAATITNPSTQSTVEDTITLIRSLSDADDASTRADIVRKIAFAVAGHTKEELTYIKENFGIRDTGAKTRLAREIAEKVATRYAPPPILVAELDLEAVLAAVPERYGYRPVSTFPPVLRDVAAVVAEDASAERVLAELTAAGGDLLESARLFDVYRGESIPAGTKSLAYALTYRVADRQLTDKEVDKAHQKIEGRLRHVLKAQIRGKDGA